MNGTDGDPDDEPAFTTRLETVNGSRFSTLSVVVPSVRRAGLTVTKADATERSTTLLKSGAIEHRNRGSIPEWDLAQRQPGFPGRARADNDDAACLARFGIGEHHAQQKRRRRDDGKLLRFNDLNGKAEDMKPIRARSSSRLASAPNGPCPSTWT